MAISRHKVLSEMQQQLELASSKCGNLQKQLEIVKDKVRQSSTTNLVQRRPPEEKENKIKNGDVLKTMGIDEKNPEYHHELSLSSSSTEDINEERDVNIIKVFYDRLGQMDYPTGHVELSDISSEENDLDIDQLLSSVNFSINSKGKPDKRKEEEKNDKKSKEKAEKPQKRKKSKGKTLKTNFTSPYESHLAKTSRQTPVKNKNQRNKLGVRPPVDGQTMLRSATKSISREQASKTDGEKLKRRKHTRLENVASVETRRKPPFHDPIKRVMNLAGELRKTKSSTGAEKKDIITDTRSLTRLQSNNAEDKQLGISKAEDSSKEFNHSPDKATKNEIPRQDPAGVKMKPQTNKGKEQIVSVISPMKATKNNVIAKKTEEIKLKSEAPLHTNRIMKDKGTSLSDLAKISANKKTVDNSKYNVSPSDILQAGLDTTPPLLRSNAAGKIAGKSIGDKLSLSGIVEKKGKPEMKVETKNHVAKIKQVETKRIETRNENDKTKNGIIPHLLPSTEDKFEKLDFRRKVSIFEGQQPEVAKKGSFNERMTKPSRGTASTITRTNSRATLNDGGSKATQELRRFPSVNNLTSELPVIQTENKEKENADINPLTINQIRRMKDNLMKFNAIPFIVGQSTAKSYHIGLNIQQTYSLFKQTPSMTALKVSRFVDNDQNSIHSRGRSTKTGFTGRSRSTVRGRDICPACGPAPDPSPEQLADPWAVPQDDDGMVIRVCTCLPKRIISFDQVLNQLYFTDMNLVKLHPSLLPNKDGTNEENEDFDGREKPATLPHRATNTLYYTKLLRSIQNLKDNILG